MPILMPGLSDEQEREYLRVRGGGTFTWATGPQGYNRYYYAPGESISYTVQQAAGVRVTTESLSPGLQEAWRQFPTARAIFELGVPVEKQQLGIVLEMDVAFADRRELWRKWTNGSWVRFDTAKESMAGAGYERPPAPAPSAPTTPTTRPSPLLTVQPFQAPIATDPEQCRAQ